MYPFLQAYPMLWNELMSNKAYRRVFGNMKARYYKDVYYRTIYQIPITEIWTTESINSRAYTKRKRGAANRISDMIYSEANAKRESGPKLYHIAYYKGMHLYNMLSTTLRRKPDPLSYSNVIDTLLSNAQDSRFCHEIRDENRYFPVHAEEDTQYAINGPNRFYARN